jgi:hypothetical protein
MFANTLSKSDGLAIENYGIYCEEPDFVSGGQLHIYIAMPRARMIAITKYSSE